MATTAVTGLTLDLRRAGPDALGVRCWPVRDEALATLAALRECGLNMDRDIEVHRVVRNLSRGWVIGRPDHLHGITRLMTGDGRWVAGRLTDTPCFCGAGRCGHAWASWARIPDLDVAPATVTHGYTWTFGTCGVIGHDGKPLMTQGFYGPPTEVLAYLAQAWCIACTWKTTGSDGPEVQARARWHRRNPHDYPHHMNPRRVPVLPDSH